jgi:prephenate dehydrogenase
MEQVTLSLVGVGLLGGSVALAARQRRVVTRVIGCDRSEDVLRRALDLHLIDEATTDLQHAVAEADIVVFCTPVSMIVEQVLQCVPWYRSGTLVTDVGSTKAAIARGIEGRLPQGVTFIGSHPLAGSEKSGPEYARADLFENRLVVVTPGKDATIDDCTRVMDFWHLLGASVKPLSPEEHDRALAMTSHLPHLVASVLAGVLPEEWRGLTATGFRDTTRIAAGNIEMWRAIFQANQPALLEMVERFREQLEEFRVALQKQDAEAITRLLEVGKVSREALSR